MKKRIRKQTPKEIKRLRLMVIRTDVRAGGTRTQGTRTTISNHNETMIHDQG